MRTEKTITRRRALGTAVRGAALGVAGLGLARRTSPARYGVIVYGGTPAGIIAAVAAARQGARVALIEPSLRLGGMMAGGLGFTDFAAGHRNLIVSGLQREFFLRVGFHYRSGNGIVFEPYVAATLLTEFVQQAGVALHRGSALSRAVRGSTAAADAPRIDAIVLEDGSSFAADVLIDCSYEGDLMARSGVSYTVGREGVAQYGESLAGVQARGFLFAGLSPYDARGDLLPEISPRPLGTPGQADSKIMAYNFRLCLSDDPANMVRFLMPPGYDPGRYALLRRIVTDPDGLHATFGQNFLLHALPNRKWDMNNGGFFSTDYCGGSYAYPNAGYAERRRIWHAHYAYMAGLLYFVANDPSVPASLRDEANAYGLAKDEFVDTGNWPSQLYVREARRMIGQYVMTQRDVTVDTTKPDPVAIGAYPLDCHYTQRALTPGRQVVDEGDLLFSHPPSPAAYQIPFRALLPRRGDVANLLVPVCLSASHVAFCSLRIEGQYMALGQAAGTAAAMASRSRTPLRQLDWRALASTLLAHGAILSLPKLSGS